LFYYLCFASGLFFDSKRKSSIVQERLKVKPSEYWFANAVAAFVVMAAVSVAFGFFTPSHRGIQFAPTPNEAQTRTFVLGVQTTENLLLLFSVSLWCAAFKTSRLVAGTVTLVVFYFVFFCWIDGHYKASVILGYENAKGATLLASMLVVLVFAFASFKIVTGRTHSRKTPWSVAIPIVLTLSFVTLRMGPEPAHLPPKFHSWELDVNSFPKKQKEYDKLVDEAKSAVEKVETSPLFITSNGTDKVAVELNDLRKRFIDACALTKMRAAGLTDVENAEKAFYEALNKAIQNRSGREPEELELNGLKKFLNEIPSIRPTAEQQAENAYVFAQFGKLDSGVKSSDARDIIAKARVKNNRVWKRAFWNSIQTIPSDLTDQIKRASKVTIDDANSIRLFNETSKMFEDKPGYANNPDPKSAIRRQREYAEIFWAISPSEQSGFNELDRRTLLSNLRQSP
ncbi:MAG: hypothetical protein J6X44_01555, partial [Thermoguttaceae bacterium]|nr:hypothetical protein [Thermoguttaceae bacterium]